jgi:hypothetical protein
VYGKDLFVKLLIQKKDNANGNNNNKSADIKKLNNRSDAFYINYSDKQK